MARDYFSLSPEEQNLLLQEAQNQLNISDIAIEKDIWVCWILQQLFSLPTQMAFKGGTSLSRVFNLIDRYSEDIDITIDYRNFIEEINFQATSKAQLKKTSKALKENLQEYIATRVLPFLNKKIEKLFPKEQIKIELEDDEKLLFYYPSALNTYLVTENGDRLITEAGDFLITNNNNSEYMLDHVLIEFGIRNSTEPCDQHSIIPLIAQSFDSNNKINLPKANVDVLSPLRTFWEKATLIHVECHRDRLAETPDRLSRHWYDLAMLTNTWVGNDALSNRNILENVIEHKKAFFNRFGFNSSKLCFVKRGILGE